MSYGPKHVSTSLTFLCLLAFWGAPIEPARAQQEPPAQTPTAAPAPAPASPAAEPPIPESVKRVTYVPEVVKAELRKEIKEELLEEMKKNSWATPNALPAWTKRIKLQGDARLRYEIDNFGAGNAVDYYPDFNGINANKPFDVNFRDASSERWLDTSRRRGRALVRARLDMEADLGQEFWTELRFATGDSATPVSTHQTLGGGGGNFSKFQAWLDRLNLSYRPFGGEARELTLFIGRFENPFFRTDLTWDDNVNFDGAVVRGSLRLGEEFRPFLTGGAFPLYNTPIDLASILPNKFKSRDKWLYAIQAGTNWKPAPRLDVKLGIAFFYFDRIQGTPSSECDTNLSFVACDTDHSRPGFAQKGNTYFPLRTPSIAALEAELTENAPRYQFFGLSSRFRNLVYTGRVEMLVSPRLRVALDGEYVRNVAFRRADIAPNAVNNFRPCGTTDVECRANPPYGGGNVGYLGRMTVGSPGILHRWDWEVALTYRHLESDAFVDAFPNSEYALGGTNNKGFVAAGTLAVGDNVSFTVRWLSSDVVVGPQYSIDVVYFDLNLKY